MNGASLSNAAVRQRQEARIPAGRIADADDIAGVAVFLLSAAARYITGAWRLTAT
jgi:NAD(P)-dependent dehydrogenase (short-subunit alcohol dehydrogenase family)